MQLGRWYPNSKRPDMTPSSNFLQVRMPNPLPRRVHSHFVAQGGRPLELPWNDLNIASEIYTVKDSGQGMEWEFLNEFAPDDVMVLHYEIRHHVQNSPDWPVEKDYGICWWEFWHEGEVYGRTKENNTIGLPSETTGARWPVDTLAYVFRPHPTEFFNLIADECRSLKWGEDDYQPGRTRPS